MKEGKNQLYVMKCESYIKIGVSKRPFERIKEFQIGNPFPIELLMTIPFDNCYIYEHWLHRKYKEQKIRGEWFEIDKDIQDLIEYLAVLQEQILRGLNE